MVNDNMSNNYCLSIFDEEILKNDFYFIFKYSETRSI